MKYNRQENLIIGRTLLDNMTKLLNQELEVDYRKVLIITDKTLSKLHLEKLRSGLSCYGAKISIAIVPDGEESKSFERFQELIQYCWQMGLSRHDLIIAFGGGVIGDLAGFVAATYMRGIAYIQIPTTLLAHDSSLGGKVGINLEIGDYEAKNIVGSFHLPILTVYDLELLRTLPSKEISSGYAELIKHALIDDPDLFDYLEKHVAQLLALQEPYVDDAITKSMLIKQKITTLDPIEKDRRVILNYGHTVGHAIESISNFSISHGEAVALGMVCETYLSCKVLGCHSDVINRTKKILLKYTLPTVWQIELRSSLISKILNLMKRDKKSYDQKYSFVLLKQLGQAAFIKDIKEEDIIDSLRLTCM